ncbi:hypothetical protein ABZ897_22190 [Nonomuraea sp. NPDC046802]|uniref:hypothetical protein n=1 Tax=Nonomuraea sp. NPDC046802 TaxID=3154919 RepID=UPI00340FA300
MRLSAARAALSGAAIACAMLLTAAVPANAVPATQVAMADVNREVLLSPADQPPVGQAFQQPWINPYFEGGVTGPTCWQYGRPNGASAGISARYSTPTSFHSYNNVWVFPTADAAAAFERTWRNYLTTCVERNRPEENASFVLHVTKVGEAGGVDIMRITSGVNGYTAITQYWWVAVVRQGTAVYAVQLLDYRNGEPQAMPFDNTVAKIKQKLATYYP